ncbi:MAG: helix-turn-helix domain-containing protein [Thermoguttaceae bacterium]|jgi:hydrogenase-4 transcriptional activator|nr:helix-turn-helix domain-containing protein [Thermoguttaceae bacterium]
MTLAFSEHDLIGASTTLHGALERANLAARANVPVSIWGEPGVGKESIARLIASSSLVKLDCALLSPRRWNALLAETELSALVADMLSSLYFTNVETIPKPTQRRLALAVRSNRIKARLLLSSPRPYLESKNSDLWSPEFDELLTAFPIRLPSLSERPDDLPNLAQHFFRDALADIGAYPRSLTNKELDHIRRLDFPENLDDLRRCVDYIAKNDALPQETPVKSSVILKVNPEKQQPSREEREGDSGSREPFPSLDEVSIRHIKEALRMTGGVVEGKSGAAKLLKINPYTLRSRMRKFKIDWTKFRDE